MRRALEHPFAPALGVAVAGVAYLLIAPATADMAAHAYRTWLFERDGLAIWNAHWYGGHHVLGYSLLFTPPAAWLGPGLVGVAAAVVATAAFAPLARSAAPPGRAAAATWLFGAAVLSNVVIGRQPFTLGIAFAVCAWLCAERGGRLAVPGAALLALGAVWASPVAGAFLLLAAVARVLAGQGDVAVTAALSLPVLAGGALLALTFPEGGTDRFVATAFWPMLAISVAGLLLLAPGRRALRAGALLYVVVLVAAFVIPSPFGQNALRLSVLLGPALLVLAPRRGVPIWAPAIVLVALVYLQWLPAVRAVAEASGDPSTQRSFHRDAREFLEARARPGERVEVALTRNHWEAAYLARSVPLARGWERQLDQKANPLFYDGRALTADRYHAWLRENAIRWVALPNAPLDYSARDEAHLLERGLPYLRLAHESPEWRIWEVRDPEPPATDGARLAAATPEGFTVVSKGPTVVRQRWTRYWKADGGCVSKAPGGWTLVEPDGGGPVSVQARMHLPGPTAEAACAASSSR
jgi:hypothetical protein